MTVIAETGAPPARPKLINPLVLRLMHWINAAATIVMIGSGWQIYNAHPILPFRFPASITIGGWLGGAIQWHFAAMWILAGNFLAYLLYGLISDRFRQKLVPVTPRAVLADTLAALRGQLGHADISSYNAVQKLLYLGVIAALIVLIASGLAIWKPVQLQELTALFGGFDFARIVHFAAMSAVALFLVVHVAMSLLVPASLKAMLLGR